MKREFIPKSFRRRVTVRSLMLLALFSLCLTGFSRCAFAQEVRLEILEEQKVRTPLQEAVQSLRLLSPQDYSNSSVVDRVLDPCRIAISEYIGKNKNDSAKDIEVLGMSRADALMLIARNYLYYTVALRSLREKLRLYANDLDTDHPAYARIQKKFEEEIRRSENGMGTYVLQFLKYGFLEKVHSTVRENQKGMLWRNGHVMWEIVAEHDRSQRVSFTHDRIKYSLAVTSNNSDERSRNRLIIEVEGYDVERRTSFRRRMTDVGMNGSVEGVGSNDGNGKIRDAFKKNVSRRERTGWREKYLDALENFVIVTKFLEREPKSP